MKLSQIKRWLVGKPLSSHMLDHERIPKWKALAVLSSDALSSVAYATEEILIPLAAFSVAAVSWSIPIGLAIGALLLIVGASYRQTINSYPNGGGAYIVAKENLGQTAGLVAGASLLIDYVLTVSVSVASGVENIASAVVWMREYKEAIGITVIFVIMIFNLRGIKDSASVFAFPTYLFIVSFAIMIVVGIWKAATGALPTSAPVTNNVYPAIPLFLILRAFSSGCTALTGVEAISNGIPLFENPGQKNARTTLLWMIGILGVLFISVTFLSHVFGIIPAEGETAVSLLSRRIFGENWMYYLIQGSTALILVLAANTSYADFPRLASLLAKDRFLPRQLASLGDRLVFSNGIIGLSAGAMLLIIIYRGDTHHLIPLYAVGVFLSFTLSQSGMILHHFRERERGWRVSIIFSTVGALTTLLVLLVIGVTKFSHGAWMVILLIPILVFIFERIHIHYLAVGKELSLIGVEPDAKLEKLKHTVVVPISGMHRGTLDALRYALSISQDVRACYVELDAEATIRMQEEWKKWASAIPLVILKSPYRSVVTPLLAYIDDVATTQCDELITVLIPEFVTAKWWHQFMHNQTALFIRTALLFKRNKVVTSMRYHLRAT